MLEVGAGDSGGGELVGRYASRGKISVGCRVKRLNLLHVANTCACDQLKCTLALNEQVQAVVHLQMLLVVF